ncbi:MAG: hypothetical protein Q9221_008350 [Calogaya cf. arnoldii]
MEHYNNPNLADLAKWLIVSRKALDHVKVRKAKEDEPRRVPAKFKIKGMNKSPYAYQFLAAIIMLKMRNSITGGGILADEPGFGERNEYEGIYDRKSHKLLDLRFFICHDDSSYTSDHPSRQDLAPFRVEEGTVAPWEHQRCILFTTPGTFYGHAVSVINTEKYEWRVPQNRKRPQRHTITEKNLTAGYVVADEYHESKGSTTQLFTIIKQIKMRNPAATITGVSGTPWSRSPKDLVGIFQVMSTGREDVWAHDPVLRYAIGHNINDIVRAFKNSTKGKYPIVALPPKNVTFVDTADEFPTDLRELLAAMEGKLAAETTVAAKSEAAKKNIYFKKAWQVRAVATLPSLLRLQMDHEWLDFTWGQYIKEEFYKDPGNPYIKAADMP